MWIYQIHKLTIATTERKKKLQRLDVNLVFSYAFELDVFMFYIYLYLCGYIKFMNSLKRKLTFMWCVFW